MTGIVVPKLVFDSWQDASPACRSGRTEDRHLIYEGEGVILDLLLRQSADGSSIHVGGHVLANSSAEQVSGSAVVMEQGRRRMETQTNALGEFNFQTVPDRSFDLCIVLGRRRFEIRGLSAPRPRMWQVVPSMAGGGG